MLFGAKRKYLENACLEQSAVQIYVIREFYGVFSSLFQEQILPPRPEAYPIPTQTYTREYFTFPASKSQDRMGPAQSQWPNYEEKPQLQAESNHSINSTMQVRSNFFQYKETNQKETACFPLLDC